MSKKLLGNKPIKYLVITNPDGGHAGQKKKIQCEKFYGNLI